MASVSQDRPQRQTANPAGMPFVFAGPVAQRWLRSAASAGSATRPGSSFAAVVAAPPTGTALAAAPAPASVGSPPPTSITGREAERRRLAVIFVDLIDSVIK